MGINRENRYFVNKIFIPLEVFMKDRLIKTFSCTVDFHYQYFRRAPSIAAYKRQKERLRARLHEAGWPGYPGWCQFAGISACLLNATKINFAIT